LPSDHRAYLWFRGYKNTAPMRRGRRAVELSRAKERALIGQLIVDLLRVAHTSRLRSTRGRAKPYLAGEIENMLLGWAVLLGHAGGKPKNASEIGRYLGIPRVTAQRRLDDLEESGIIVRRGNRYHMSGDLKKADDEYVDKCMLLIKRAAQLKVR
jgi:hypothetical protein